MSVLVRVCELLRRLPERRIAQVTVALPRPRVHEVAIAARSIGMGWVAGVAGFGPEQISGRFGAQGSARGRDGPDGDVVIGGLGVDDSGTGSPRRESRGGSLNRGRRFMEW